MHIQTNKSPGSYNSRILSVNLSTRPAFLQHIAIQEQSGVYKQKNKKYKKKWEGAARLITRAKAHSRTSPYIDTYTYFVCVLLHAIVAARF